MSASESGAADLSRLYDFQGRTVVVTGGASGIGRETALTFAQAGANIVIADVSAEQLATTSSGISERFGVEVRELVTDVADRASVSKLGDHAIAEFGTLDVWVNVAGILRSFLISDATEASLRETFDVNYFGTYWGVSAAAAAMTPAGGGAIVNIASAGGEAGTPGLSAYGGTKAAVMHLTKVAAAELGPHGIRVNCVSPGWIESPMTAYHWTDSDTGVVHDDEHQATIDRMAGASPLRIHGVPNDIALAVLYLASAAARFVTGQTLRVNGGIIMA